MNAEHHDRTSPSTTRNILVVEDDEALGLLISRRLMRDGFKAESVTTGERALAIWHPEMAILLDQRLPDMTGHELIEKLHNQGHKPFFIVMTGQGDERLAVEMMKLGADDYLVKTIDFMQILPQAFARLFTRRETEARLEKAEEDRRRLEAQLRQEQRLSAIGTLASGVAHEINNPLNVMINYAQLLLDRLSPREHQLLEFCQEILDEGQRIATIVRNLLSFSRVDQAGHRLESPQHLVEGVLSLIGKLLAKDEIALSVEIQPDLPMIECSGPQIQQIILNLIINGRDAVNERYPGYHPEKKLVVRVAVQPMEVPCVRFSVTDSGSGIPESIREKIFHPFFTTKDPDKGTGLGLSICQNIAHEHHGVLTFETDEGKGTSFHLDIPSAQGGTGP
ncbi:MAG TPA: ATP-binding protein [Spirochaetota bacterium]|nr:ATP-binding protein [Spirochaetota bacterium]